MRTFQKLWPYLRRYRWHIVAGMVCLVVVDVIQLYFPLYQAGAIDALKVRDVAEMRRELAVMVLLAVSIIGGRYLWRSLLLGASRKIERDLRDDFFAKLLRVPQSHIDQARSGDLLSLSTNDIAVIRQFLGFGMMSMCDATVLITVSIFLMATLSLKLTLLVAIPLPFVTFAMVKLGHRLHNAHEKTQDCFGELSARLQEDVYGVRVIRAYGQEENRTKRFLEQAEDYARRNLIVIRLQGFFYPLLKFLTGTAAVLVLYFGGREVVRGALTLGQFVAFAEYVAMLSWPLMALGWIINLVQRGRASMERINRVMDVAEETQAETGAARTGNFQHLEIRGLSQVIRLDTPASQDVFAFHDVRLAVKRGEWVGIAGRTASGKTALVSRILRTYDPPAGAIFLDGVDITTMDRAHLRRRIAFVPQEGFLFSQSLLSNFKLGARAAPDEDVEAVVEAVQMKTEIAGFGEGLRTRVGERGVTLSGGQRQRVAIGRALLKDADFYILDDPFSAVDLETEEKIFAALKARLRDRGVILISHRFRTLAWMDRIIVIDSGRMVEEGAHEDLMRRGGLYARLAEAEAIEDRLRSREQPATVGDRR